VDLKKLHNDNLSIITKTYVLHILFLHLYIFFITVSILKIAYIVPLIYPLNFVCTVAILAQARNDFISDLY